MNRTLQEMIVLVCRLGVGGIFVFASLDKLQNPAAFATIIHHYRMVPYELLHAFAVFLPVLEIIVGSALILGIQQRGAALITLLLNVVFIAAIATALSRGLDISCGCFNTDGGHGVGTSLIMRDILLLVACFPPLVFSSGKWTLNGLFKR